MFWFVVEVAACVAIVWSWYSFGKDKGYRDGYRAGLAAFFDERSTEEDDR